MSADTTEDAPFAPPDTADGEAPADGSVLFPVLDGGNTEGTLSVSVDVARYNDATLLILIARAGSEIPLDGGFDDVETCVLGAGDGRDVSAGGFPGIGTRSGRIVANALEAHDVGTLVVEDEPADGLASFVGSAADRIAAGSACDVVVAAGMERFADITSILVPVAGGPHSGLAVDTARALAEGHDAWIDLFHVVDGDATERREQAERYLEAGVDRLGGFDDVDTWVLEADDAADAIIEQSGYYSITVLGAPRKGRLRQFVFGSTTDHVREAARSPVLTVRSGRGDGSWIDRWLGGGT